MFQKFKPPIPNTDTLQSVTDRGATTTNIATFEKGAILGTDNAIPFEIDQNGVFISRAGGTFQDGFDSLGFVSLRNVGALQIRPTLVISTGSAFMTYDVNGVLEQIDYQD